MLVPDLSVALPRAGAETLSLRTTTSRRLRAECSVHLVPRPQSTFPAAGLATTTGTSSTEINSSTADPWSARRHLSPKERLRPGVAKELIGRTACPRSPLLPRSLTRLLLPRSLARLLLPRSLARLLLPWPLLSRLLLARPLSPTLHRPSRWATGTGIVCPPTSGSSLAWPPRSGKVARGVSLEPHQRRGLSRGPRRGPGSVRHQGPVTNHPKQPTFLLSRTMRSLRIA